MLINSRFTPDNEDTINTINTINTIFKNEYAKGDTLTFPDLVKNGSNSNEHEHVSYDVESLFTIIRVQETINYLVDRIYVRKEIEPFCKKSIFKKRFKKLFKKLTKGCVFSVTEKKLKSAYGCCMGRSIYVGFSDIFMCKMELDVTVPAKPIFYKGYVDDTYVRKKEYHIDKLFEKLNP